VKAASEPAVVEARAEGPLAAGAVEDIHVRRDELGGEVVGDGLNLEPLLQPRVGDGAKEGTGSEAGRPGKGSGAAFPARPMKLRSAGGAKALERVGRRLHEHKLLENSPKKNQQPKMLELTSRS